MNRRDILATIAGVVVLAVAALLMLSAGARAQHAAPAAPASSAAVEHATEVGTLYAPEVYESAAYRPGDVFHVDREGTLRIVGADRTIITLDGPTLLEGTALPRGLYVLQSDGGMVGVEPDDLRIVD